jgi:hypothetical protein
VIRLLQEYHVSVEARHHTPPLQTASNGDHLEVVRRLFEYNAYVNAATLGMTEWCHWGLQKVAT